jgi:hypothetical protein
MDELQSICQEKKTISWKITGPLLAMELAKYSSCKDTSIVHYFLAVVINSIVV